MGRDPVTPNLELLTANVHGKVVMITGAGGSIGSEITRQLLRLGPKTLVLFDLSEVALYEISMEIEEASAKIRSGPPHDDDDDLGAGIWAGVIPITETIGALQPCPLLPAGIVPGATTTPYGPGRHFDDILRANVGGAAALSRARAEAPASPASRPQSRRSSAARFAFLRRRSTCCSTS